MQKEKLLIISPGGSKYEPIFQVIYPGKFRRQSQIADFRNFSNVSSANYGSKVAVSVQMKISYDYFSVWNLICDKKCLTYFGLFRWIVQKIY